jgi:hypothetical protein
MDYSARTLYPIDMALQGSSDVVLEFHPSFEEILESL